MSALGESMVGLHNETLFTIADRMDKLMRRTPAWELAWTILNVVSW